MKWLHPLVESAGISVAIAFIVAVVVWTSISAYENKKEARTKMDEDVAATIAKRVFVVSFLLSSFIQMALSF